MKDLLVLITLIFFMAEVFGQSNLSIKNSEKVIGKNYVTGKDITAEEYVFPERIHNSYVDEDGQTLTVWLRGGSKNGVRLNNSGKVIMYNLSDQKEMWSKKINYQTSEVVQYDDLVIHKSSNNIACLDPLTGKDRWKVKNSLYYVDPTRKTGIGYRFNIMSGYTNLLEGINLSDGKKLWEREIKKDYGWNDVVPLNDSVIVVTAAGLHAVNLNNGSGWDLDAVTGEKDYKATIAANVAGVAFGLLTGSFMIATGHNLVSGVASNTLVDEGNIYFASRKHIVCLTVDGDVKWMTDFPKKQVSSSVLFVKDDTVYMVNRGYAYLNGDRMDYGVPFIAAFDKNTGEQFFLNPVGTEKKRIEGFKLDDEFFYLISGNKIALCSARDGSFVSEKTLSVEETGNPSYFVGDQTFMQSDSIYIPVIASDSAEHFIFTDKGTIVAADKELNVVKQLTSDRLYTCCMTAENYRFLVNNRKTIIIDNNGAVIAEFEASANAFMVNSFLYDMRENSLIRIDVSEFTEDRRNDEAIG